MQVGRAAWAWLLALSGAAGLGAVHGSDAQRRLNEAGQTLAEYSLLLGLVAVTAIVALAGLGAITSGVFWDPINRVIGEVIAMITT
jgi:Flp pilus assembly pilin Flp